MINLTDYTKKIKSHDHRILADKYILDLPNKPYCSENLDNLIIMNKDIALTHKHIQHNPVNSISTLVLDCDYSTSHYHWSDIRSPPPHFAIMNKLNGHSHLIYQINNKVFKNNVDKMRPYRLLCAIHDQLRRKLNADFRYSGLISHNLISDHWQRYDFQHWAYDLYDFLEWMSLPKDVFKEGHLFEYGEGRNCSLFDELRLWAYREFNRQKGYNHYDLFFNVVFSKALVLNSLMFAIPLYNNEVKQIAKSISKWCMNHMSDTEFIQIQSRRGTKSGKVRQEKASNLYIEIKELKLTRPELSNRKIALLLSTSEGTVRNALKHIKPTSDNSELFEELPSLWE